MPSSKKHQKVSARGLKYGYRSGLEETIGAFLKAKRIPFGYESIIIPYTKPETIHKYTPDFVLPNGIIIETKGRFVVADRQKHLLIKKQFPDLDIRFVFSNPRNRINKGSPTTYAKWAERYGFQWAAKSIPLSWLKEPPNQKSINIIRTLPSKKKG